MRYTAREVEQFQLWAKRAEIERIISFLKMEIQEINKEVKRVAKLVNQEKRTGEIK